MSQKVTKFIGGLGIDATSKFEIQSNASVTVGDGTTTGNVVIGGEVGIGTSSPSSTLQVGDGSADTRGTFNPNTAFAIGVKNGSNHGGFIGSGGTNVIQFSSSGGAERMRIDSSGNVGIGTNTPSSKLDVSGDIEGDGLIIDGTFDLGTL